MTTPQGEMVPMKPSQIAAMLQLLIAAKQPVIVWGAPGISKSAVGQQTAAALGRKAWDVRGSLIDPVDLRGIPYIDKGRTRNAPPSFLPTVADGPTLIILEEMNRAPVMVQNALLQLTLDRRIGEYELPDTCEIIACCNRETDGGGVVKMPQALSNRFVHLLMEPDVNDWCRWAAGAGIEPATIAFIRSFPHLLFAFDTKAKAWPSPRSWEFVSRITAQKPGNGIEHALYSGTVGEGAGVEYSAFLRMFRELPNPDAILLNPASAAVPTSPASLYAVAAALARYATPANFGRILTYLERMPIEYNVCCVQDATRREPALATGPEFTAWSVKHSEVMM